jgi:flagella basal body P-ring formation protein FlgA
MGQVRIRINVKCLQSGSQGDMIRVRDEQTQRIYLASVVDKNHVRVER